MGRTNGHGSTSDQHTVTNIAGEVWTDDELRREIFDLIMSEKKSCRLAQIAGDLGVDEKDVLRVIDHGWFRKEGKCTYGIARSQKPRAA